MATIQSFLVCDNSTLANFKSWAQAISTALSTFTWVQSSDTGQVNWSTIASVPGSGALVYEIWKPNDGLTNFFLKVEYGNFTSQTNYPDVRISISNSTDGAGNLNGFIIGPFRLGMVTGVASTGAVNTYECDFSGAAGRFACLMWRTAPTPFFFAVERSVNSSGSYTGAYVSFFSAGGNMQFGGRQSGRQQSLLFGIGSAPASVSYVENTGSAAATGLITRGFNPMSGTSYGTATNSYAFNGTIGMDLATPFIGYFDYPCTTVGIGQTGDLAEGVPFQCTLYGSTKTYIPTNQGYMNFCSNNQNFRLCMRYD